MFSAHTHLCTLDHSEDRLVVIKPRRSAYLNGFEATAVSLLMMHLSLLFLFYTKLKSA